MKSTNIVLYKCFFNILSRLNLYLLASDKTCTFLYDLKVFLIRLNRTRLLDVSNELEKLDYIVNKVDSNIFKSQKLKIEKYSLDDGLIYEIDSCVKNIINNILFIKNTFVEVYGINDFNYVELTDSIMENIYLNIKNKSIQFETEDTFLVIDEIVYRMGKSYFHFYEWDAFFMTNIVDNPEEDYFQKIDCISYFNVDLNNQTIVIAGNNRAGWFEYNFVNPKIECLFSPVLEIRPVSK